MKVISSPAPIMVEPYGRINLSLRKIENDTAINMWYYALLKRITHSLLQWDTAVIRFLTITMLIRLLANALTWQRTRISN